MTTKRTKTGKKPGRPKGRKDSKPRKKKTTFEQRRAAALKAAETRRRKAGQSEPPATKSEKPSAPADATDARAGVTGKDAAPGVVPYPTAGDNPAFQAFLREESAGDAPCSTGDKAAEPTPGGDAGAPAWTSAAVQDAYRGIGEVIHAVSGDPADKMQPYELRLLSGPNNVRFINRQIGPDKGENVDLYVFAGTNAVVLGPRVIRNAKPLLRAGVQLAQTILLSLGLAKPAGQGQGQKAQSGKTQTETRTPKDGFDQSWEPDHR